MKTAIYLRKSRADEQNTEDTLKKHKTSLLEYAEKNNLTVIKTYEEIVSGESLFARPQMLLLLQDVEKGLYDAVLCMDIDRLGRGDMQEQGLIMNTFKNSDTKIITPREVYNPQNEKDEMFFEFKGIIARNELKAIKRRMLEGTKRTIASGGYVAEPPYGYIRKYKDKIPTLEIYEEQAKYVRMAFDMYVNLGMGSQSIAETFNSMGLKTRRGTPFARNSIRFILQNKTYIGKVQWNRNKTVGVNKRKIAPEDEWVVCQGLHEPIIDEETFNKAQVIRSSRSHPPSNTGLTENPLAGLLKCNICGKPLVRQNLKRKYNNPRLICTTKGCVKSVLSVHVEKRIYNEIIRFIKECDFNLKPKTDVRAEIIRAVLQGYEKQLKILRNQMSCLHDLLEQGVYDANTFCERKNKLMDEISHIETKIKEQQQLPKEESFLPQCASITENSYWSLSASKKNQLLKQLISEITYEKSKDERNDEFYLQIRFAYV